MSKKLKIEKSETIYRPQLNASDYDYLEITIDIEGRMMAKFLATRWRTPEKTVALFREIADTIESSFLPTPTPDTQGEGK